VKKWKNFGFPLLLKPKIFLGTKNLWFSRSGACGLVGEA
jgi:hypothetical protein